MFVVWNFVCTYDDNVRNNVIALESFQIKIHTHIPTTTIEDTRTENHKTLKLSF